MIITGAVPDRLKAQPQYKNRVCCTGGDDGGCGRWRARRQGYDLSARRFEEAEEDLAALLRLVREE